MDGVEGTEVDNLRTVMGQGGVVAVGRACERVQGFLPR